MTRRVYQLRTIIRQGSARVLGESAVIVYCGLQDRQPLLLHREPENPHHAGAVLVTELTGAACGYVASEHAGEVSAKIAEGLVLMCRAVGPCLCSERRILIWADAEEQTDSSTKEQEMGRI
jgi:hypothetical protein